MSTGIGSRLTEAREAKGLSRTDLGLMLDVPSELIAAWELGLAMPQTYKCQQMCRALGLQPDAITFTVPQRKQRSRAVDAPVGTIAFSGDALKRIRKERGMTLKQLAVITGMGESQIYTYESGRKRPRRETAADLAEALGVEPEALYVSTPVEEQK